LPRSARTLHPPPQTPLLPLPAQKQDFIRGQDGGLRSGATREAHERGLATLQAYCSGAGCRHAALVNYFQPGARSPPPP
jgi:hypothetical protein